MSSADVACTSPARRLQLQTYLTKVVGNLPIGTMGSQLYNCGRFNILKDSMSEYLPYGLITNCLNVRQTCPVCEGWQSALAEDSVKFLLPFPLDLRVQKGGEYEGHDSARGLKLSYQRR